MSQGGDRAYNTIMLKGDREVGAGRWCLRRECYKCSVTRGRQSIQHNHAERGQGGEGWEMVLGRGYEVERILVLGFPYYWYEGLEWEVGFEK